MSVDLASLALKIDSSSVPKGVAELDRLTASGTRAEVATEKLAASSRTASAAAAQYAAQAQRSASAAMGLSSAHGAGAASANLNRMQMLELTHVVRALADSAAAGINPLRALAMESGRIGQIAASSAGGFGGLIKTLLTMTGILKTTTDAEVAATAASAASFERLIAAKAGAARASIEAADADMALAQAELRVAETATARAVAQGKMADIQKAITAASAEAVIADNALAAANEEVAATAEHAAAAETTALAPLGAVLAAVAVAAGTAFVALKHFKDEIDDPAGGLAFAKSLGLTNKEFKELTKNVGDLNSKEMRDLNERAQAFGVTWGDVFHGMVKTAQDDFPLVGQVAREMWNEIKSGVGGAVSASAIGAAAIYAAFAGGFDAIKIIWGSLPAILGDIAAKAANAVIDQLNLLIKGSTAAINGLVNAFNQVSGQHIGNVSAPVIGHVQESGAALKTFGDIVGATAKRYNEARGAEKQFYDDLQRNTIGARNARIKDAADTIIEDRNAAKAKKAKRDTLGDEIRSIEELIQGNYKLANAYGASDAAALKQEITTKATAEAIKKHADITQWVALKIRQSVSEGAVDAAKQAANLRGETDLRQILNNQVAQGLVTSAQASVMIKDEAQLRPLLAKQAIAEGAAKAELTKHIAELRVEQKRSNDEAIRTQDIAARDATNRQIAMLEKEIALTGQLGKARLDAISHAADQRTIGISGAPLNNPVVSNALEAHLAAINVQHEKAANLIKAESEAERLRAEGMNAAADALLRQVAAENNLIDLKAKWDGETAAVNHFSEALTALQSIAASLDFGAVFGKGGAAIADMAASLDKLTESQNLHDAAIKAAGGDQAKIAKADQAYTQAKLSGTVATLHAAKGLFAEQSAGYKMIDAAEKGAAAVAIVHTAIHVAKGAAKMFASLGPFAFPVVAAMIAVMASLGFKGGSSSATPPPSAQDLQDNAGTGSVLGDPKAKSNSIANSIDIIASNTNRDLEYSNSMLIALKSIDANISHLAGNVARQITVSGSLFDTSKLNLGSSGSAGFLGLFSSSKTRELWDAGLTLASANVADIVSKGIAGSTYQIVQQIKKNSGFLGIGGGTKTTYETTNGAVDPSILSAIQDVVRSLRDGLVVAAGTFGIEGAQAMIDSFKVELGTISFKGLTGDEIEKQLNAIFSKVGDDMAGTVLPSLAEIQKIGEGLFETFMRAAREYQVVDVALRSLGLTFGAVGVASIAARDDLVQLLGGLDSFSGAINFYRDNFLTEAERMAPVMDAVATEMARLNLAGVDTLSGFKAVVGGLDLTSQAGRELFAALMNVAPAFSSVEKYQQKLADDTAAAAATATALNNKRLTMEATLMELTGDKAGALAIKRSLELAAMDQSLRPLQAQIYLQQDIAVARDVLNASYQRERSELTATVAKYAQMADGLRSLRASLDTAGGAGGSYGSALASLKSTGAMAGLGSESAVNALSGVVQTFLTEAKSHAASSVDYRRDVARAGGYVDSAISATSGMANAAQAQLNALDQSVAGLVRVNDSVVSVHDALASLQDLLAAPTLAMADDTAKAREEDKQSAQDMIAELRGMRDEYRIGTAALKVDVAKTAAILSAVTRGDRWAVMTDGDTLAVNQV